METRFSKHERNQDNKRTVGPNEFKVFFRWSKRVGEIILETF
jgi:hypothetical protein